MKKLYNDSSGVQTCLTYNLFPPAQNSIEKTKIKTIYCKCCMQSSNSSSEGVAPIKFTVEKSSRRKKQQPITSNRIPKVEKQMYMTSYKIDFKAPDNPDGYCRESPYHKQVTDITETIYPKADSYTPRSKKIETKSKANQEVFFSNAPESKYSQSPKLLEKKKHIKSPTKTPLKTPIPKKVPKTINKVDKSLQTSIETLTATSAKSKRKTYQDLKDNFEDKEDYKKVAINIVNSRPCERGRTKKVNNGHRSHFLRSASSSPSLSSLDSRTYPKDIIGELTDSEPFCDFNDAVEQNNSSIDYSDCPTYTIRSHRNKVKRFVEEPPYIRNCEPTHNSTFTEQVCPKKETLKSRAISTKAYFIENLPKQEDLTEEIKKVHRKYQNHHHHHQSKRNMCRHINLVCEKCLVQMNIKKSQRLYRFDLEDCRRKMENV